jgi:hypothetical protein
LLKVWDEIAFLITLYEDTTLVTATAVAVECPILENKENFQMMSDGIADLCKAALGDNFAKTGRSLDVAVRHSAIVDLAVNRADAAGGSDVLSQGQERCEFALCLHLPLFPSLGAVLKNSPSKSCCSATKEVQNRITMSILQSESKQNSSLKRLPRRSMMTSLLGLRFLRRKVACDADR